MPRWTIAFVHFTDRLNHRVGRFAMYLLFVLMAVLMWSTVTKLYGRPSLWTLEMAQFIMVAYYILGGPYSMQLGSHVRMDLFYARWTLRQKAWTDAFTVFALLIYLGVMIWGAADSLAYALQLKWDGLIPEIGRLERSPTAFRPHLWPIKSVLFIGFVLMFLQSLTYLIRDIAIIRGEEI